MGKRNQRRVHKRKPFCALIYYYETFNFPGVRLYSRNTYGTDNAARVPIAAGGKFAYKKRMFHSYIDAVAYLTEVKMGLIIEDGAYCHCTPYKIVEGYKNKGRTIVTKTTVLVKPELKNERLGVRRNEFSDRLFRKQRGPLFPISEDMESVYTTLYSGSLGTT